MLQLVRATTTTIHNPCGQRGLLCGGDLQLQDCERCVRFALEVPDLRYLFEEFVGVLPFAGPSTGSTDSTTCSLCRSVERPFKPHSL
jgi:hypothetical protein